MDNVFTFDPSAKAEKNRREALLEVVNEIKRQIEEGTVKELVACTLDSDGDCQIHASALDLPGAIGLFEIGKHMLIQTNQEDL
jgi:hypothetical protein